MNEMMKNGGLEMCVVHGYRKLFFQWLTNSGGDKAAIRQNMVET